jgi:hypothetical protein
MWMNEGAIAISDSFVCYVYYQSNEEKVGLFTLDKITGSSLWHHTFDADWSYSPRIANGIVYLVEGSNYYLWGFDLKTGDTVFFDDSAEYWYCPIFTEHTMFIQTLYGGLKAFRKAATSVESFEAAEPPQSIHLFQNYPNPFNPETNIEFGLPEVSEVRLKVYNMLGQVVGDVVDEVLEAGYYNISWDANELPAGVYFCRIETDNYSETRRMVYLK